MAEELGERTEAPTGRKLGKARNEGNIAKSADFSAAVDLSGAFIALLVLGPGLFTAMSSLLRVLLDGSSFGSPDQPDWINHLLEFAGTRAVLMAAPFLVALFLVALVAQFMQVGWLWTLKPITPKFTRLNPLQGAKRLVGKSNITKMAVNFVKLSVVGTVAVSIASGNTEKLAQLPELELVAAFKVVGDMIEDLLIWILSILLVIGICDYFFQRWHRTQKLKMTKQEVKEEVKQMEGDLQAKARRLSMARSIVYQKMAESVKTADVVVTNPTHFAVALKYDAGKMAAPTVVAKGGDYMAFRIRQIARDAGVPIIEKPPLARGLYHGVDVGRAILPEYYQAVAEILAYVYRLKGRAA